MIDLRKLQDALDWFEKGVPIEGGDSPTERMDLIVAAARLVADPNIKAAVASVFTKGGAGRSGQEWPVEMYPSDIARAIAAALTPGDNE